MQKPSNSSQKGQMKPIAVTDVKVGDEILVHSEDIGRPLRNEDRRDNNREISEKKRNSGAIQW